MTGFEVHSIETAPEGSAPLLKRAKEIFGAVPNLQAVMAASPALLEGYQLLYELGGKTSFSALERQVIYLSISFENGCNYCMAAHSFQALKRDGVPEEIVRALRENLPIDDTKLETLRRFARDFMRHGGHLDAAAHDALISAGYTKQQILELILLTAVKVMSNYTNQVVNTPLDKPFVGFKWEKPA